MKTSSIICTTVGALALTAVATTMPAEARHGFEPGLAGGVIAGALVAGAASSAYAYGPGLGYVYGGYESEPGYYAPYGHPYETYGAYNESQHGGQPSYSQPW